MSRVESLASSLKFRAVRGVIPVFSILLALVSPALAQDFTMSMGNFFPFAVNQGGQANATLTLNPQGISTGGVNLTCAVTTSATNAILPTCTISPSSVTPPGSATVIVNTVDSSNKIATPANYTITVSATDSSTINPVTASENIAVLTTTADYTLTIETLLAPSSVVAGNLAQATISVNPINGYSGVVTLSCSTVTPLTYFPPVCQFAYPKGKTGLPVNGVATPVTLTIQTFGPVPTAKSLIHHRIFYALWLPLPLLAVFGLGASGRKSKKALGLLVVLLISGSFLLMPACGNSSPITSGRLGNQIGAVTPANTYTFTLTGVDQNGIVSSNTGAAGGALTVTLTVTAPK